MVICQFLCLAICPPSGQLQTTGLQVVDADPSINKAAPSIDEVKEGAAKLRDGKTADICIMSAGLLKAAVVHRIILNHFQKGRGWRKRFVGCMTSPVPHPGKKEKKKKKKIIYIYIYIYI